MTDLVQALVQLRGQFRRVGEASFQVRHRDVPHRGQPDELRVPQALRQPLEFQCRGRGGGLVAVLELRVQPDPESLQRQLGIGQAAADADDLVGDRQRVGDVGGPVEREGPVGQDGGERARVPGRARHGDGPVAELAPFGVGAGGVQPVGEPGHDHGPGTAVGAAQPLQGLGQERLRAGVEADGRREDTAVPEGGPQEQSTVGQVTVRQVPGGVRRLGEPVVAGRVLTGPVMRARQLEEQFAAQPLVLQGVFGAEPVRQPQRPAEVPHGDLRRDLGQGPLPGQALIGGRLLGGALRGRAEVMRQLGGRRAGTGLEGLADPVVQPGPAAAAQLLGGDPPGQRVREPPVVDVAARGTVVRRPGGLRVLREPRVLREHRVVDFGDQARPLGLLQQGDGGGLLQPRRRGQQGRVEPLADQGRDRENLRAARRQAPDPGPDHVTHGLRDPRRGAVVRGRPGAELPALGQVPAHLQEIERVARGFPFEPVDDIALPPGEQRRDRAAGQAAQGQAAAVDVPGQGWQRGAELAPLGTGVPVHGHGQERRGPPGPHQVGEQDQGRLVRPLQIIEDQQDRVARRHPPEPGVDRLEQAETLSFGRRQGPCGGNPEPLGRDGADPGGLRGQAGHVLAQHPFRAGARVVGQRLPERLVRGEHVLVPPPVQDQPVIAADTPRQLGGQRRLSDPGLPGDERQDAAAVPGGRPRLAQDAEFSLAADERRAERGLQPRDVRGGRLRRPGPAGEQPRLGQCRRLGGDPGRGGSAWSGAGGGTRGLFGGGHRLSAGDRHESRALCPVQVQRAGQHLRGVPARGQVDGALQVADRPGTHARGDGQLVLGQPRFGAQPPQQSREPGRRLLRHGRFPSSGSVPGLPPGSGLRLSTLVSSHQRLPSQICSLLFTALFTATISGLNYRGPALSGANGRRVLPRSPAVR
jgi:hypothetical protein